MFGHVGAHGIDLALDDAGQVMAYCRILQPGSAFQEVSIGRVSTHPDNRHNGWGKLIMEKAINFIDDKYGPVAVKIEAQYYLERFYANFGFETSGSVYLLDGIEHVEMLRDKNAVNVKA